MGCALCWLRARSQGFVWGINSFDQWGVQLGKVLATSARAALKASRGGAPVPPSFNPSTARMMARYLAKSP